MNWARILHLLSTFAIVLSAALAVPAVCALMHEEWRALSSFGTTALFALVPGIPLRALTRKASRGLHRREIILLVAACFVFLAHLGAIPYLVSGVIPRPDQALFESASGFSTAGCTVLSKLESLPRSILLWRSLTHWLGGLLVVILFISVLPVIGAGGRLTSYFESIGIDKDDHRPRVRETGVLLVQIYAGLTTAHVLILVLCGIPIFDALIVAFGAISSGGFSNYDKSIAHFASPAVEIATCVFMFLAGTSLLLLTRIRRDGFGCLFRDPEWLTYVSIVAVAVLICTISLLATGMSGSAADAVRLSAFQVISLGSGTGFSTTDFNAWPDSARAVLLILMFVGGCTCSTSGGLKVIRLILIVKCLAAEVRRYIRPHRISAVCFGGQPVSQDVVRGTLVLFSAAVVVLATATVLLTATGMDLVSSVSSAISAFACVGPALGLAGPAETYAGLDPFAYVVLTMLMFLGRLEIFGFLVLFLPTLYKD